MIPWANPSQHHKQFLDQFSHFAGLTKQDWQTDHASPYVANRPLSRQSSNHINNSDTTATWLCGDSMLQLRWTRPHPARLSQPERVVGRQSSVLQLRRDGSSCARLPRPASGRPWVLQLRRYRTHLEVLSGGWRRRRRSCSIVQWQHGLLQVSWEVIVVVYLLQCIDSLSWAHKPVPLIISHTRSVLFCYWWLQSTDGEAADPEKPGNTTEM